MALSMLIPFRLLLSSIGDISEKVSFIDALKDLGAELIDLGFDTDLAADVEQMFDKFNIFEDIADDTAIGRLTEGLVQIGVPGGIGFKLASQAIKAKKNDVPSFTYNGKKYVKKTKGHLVFYKSA